MKLATFQSARGPRLGAVTAGGMLDLVDAGARLGRPLPTGMQDLIEAGEAAWDDARAVIDICPEEHLVANASLRAPLPRPVRLRDACLFLEHLEISFQLAGMPFSEEFKKQIIYYNADNLHIFGSGEDVPWPRASTERDYELEWACVVGRCGRNVPASSAASFIFGYTIFNDWSARDLQMPFMQGHLGPAGGKDFANSIGPYIVTPDEISDPYALQMTARVNGETWSRGATASMHHRFEDAIVRFSEDRLLVAGEIIGSGTVLSGCGFEIGRQLELGDVVELEIQNIGILRNKIIPALEH